MTDKAKADLKMFDLFAGCGGLSLGLEQAGFTPIFVNELNDDARSTYLTNRGFDLAGTPFNKRTELHSGSIYELTNERMNSLKTHLVDLELIREEQHGTSLDLICGGPPCQGFSGIGHRRSYAVEKKDIPSNQLFEKMADVIEFFRPKVFLFENVKGLLSSKWTSEGEKGEIWRDVWKRFNDIDGYLVQWQLVASKDYGVPQNRPRVLLVGLRQDVLLQSKLDFNVMDLEQSYDLEMAVDFGFLPKPSGEVPSPEALLEDLIDEQVLSHFISATYPKDFETTTYPEDAKNKFQEQLRKHPKSGKGLKKGDPVTDHEYSKHSAKVVSKFLSMHENGGEILPQFRTKKFAQRLLGRHWPKEGPNITATSLPDDYVHFSQPRCLTVREWARLQMFPDWYQFLGKRTTGGHRRAGNPKEGIFDRDVPKYTQIGNAVPVELARKIGIHFAQILDF